MRRIRAILQILFSDKWAVFTFENAPEDPEWLTAPYFRWNLSDKDTNFLELIQERIKCIIKYASEKQS